MKISNLNLFLAKFSEKIMRFGFTTNSEKNKLIRVQIAELMAEAIEELKKEQEKK